MNIWSNWKWGSVPEHVATFLFVWLQLLPNSHFYCMNILRPGTEIKITVYYILCWTIDFILLYFPPIINLFCLFFSFLFFPVLKTKQRKQLQKIPFSWFYYSLSFVSTIKLSGRGECFLLLWFSHYSAIPCCLVLCSLYSSHPSEASPPLSCSRVFMTMHRCCSIFSHFELFSAFASTMALIFPFLWLFFLSVFSVHIFLLDSQ